MDCLCKSTQGPNLDKNLKLDFMEAVSQTRSLEWCCYIVAMVRLSYKKYGELVKLLSCTVVEGSIVPLVVDGITVPSLLKPMKSVKRECKRLFSESMMGRSMKKIEGENESEMGFQIKLESYINFILTTTYYTDIIKKSSNRKLEIMVNADALPVAGGNAFIVSYSIGNMPAL